MKADLLDAEWKAGDVCEWVWQRPTRVSGFELEETLPLPELMVVDPKSGRIEAPSGGELVSIIVGYQEQMLGAAFLIDLAQWWPQGVPESPAPGWKIGRIALPVMRPGQVMRVVTRNFRGRLRPFGMQVP